MPPVLDSDYVIYPRPPKDLLREHVRDMRRRRDVARARGNQFWTEYWQEMLDEAEEALKRFE